MTRVVRSPLWLVLVACAPLVAHADGPEGLLEQDLSRVEAGVAEVVQRAVVVRQQTTAGEEVYGLKRAMDRYQDAVVKFMLEDYEPAAETFFALVATGALDGIGLGWDAEWYLAESLFFMGNDDLAEAQYRDVAKDLKHPFRDDAVRRLLEIYSRDADPSKFDTLYETEIVRGRVQPSDVILYSVGRAFHRKRNLVKAKSYFLEIPAESAYWARAQYQLGSMLVEDGSETSLRDSMIVFTRLGAYQATTPEDERVVELAQLALGRVHEHLGEWRDAAEAYGKVPLESPYAPDKLRELAWVFIQARDFPAALAVVDEFMSRFADHAFAAELRLVQGHLQFEQRQWPASLVSYEGVIEDYVPVRERFAALAEPGSDASEFFDELVGEDEGGVWKPKDPESLPHFAVELLLQDRDFSRALGLYRDLQVQDRALTRSEEILVTLEPALGGPEGVGALQRVRYGVLDGQVLAARRTVELLEVQARWLSNRGAASGKLSAARDALGALAARLSPVEQQVAGGRVAADAPTGASAVAALESTAGAEVARILAELARVRKDFAALRSAAGVDELDPTVTRIDVSLDSASDAAQRMRDVLASVSSAPPDELERLRAMWRTEKVAAGQERADLTAREGAVEALAVDVARDNFRRLAGEFAESILGADMGIVNVQWSRWVADGEEQEAVTNERNDAVDAVEARYDLVSRGEAE